MLAETQFVSFQRRRRAAGAFHLVARDPHPGEFCWGPLAGLIAILVIATCFYGGLIWGAAVIIRSVVGHV